MKPVEFISGEISKGGKFSVENQRLVVTGETKKKGIFGSTVGKRCKCLENCD